MISLSCRSWTTARLWDSSYLSCHRQLWVTRGWTPSTMARRIGLVANCLRNEQRRRKRLRPRRDTLKQPVPREKVAKLGCGMLRALLVVVAKQTPGGSCVWKSIPGWYEFLELPVGIPMLSFSLRSSSSRALFLSSSSWTVSSRAWAFVFRTSSRACSRASMCSFVRARMARWASRSFARLRAS